MSSKRCHNDSSDGRVRKHPKLPPPVTAVVPSSLASIVEEFAEDCDSIQFYEHARRFEKNVVEKSTVESDSDNDDGPRATEFVELYFDTSGNNNNKLKTVKGVKWRWFRHNEEEEEEGGDNNDDDSTLTELPVPNSWMMRPAPTALFTTMQDSAKLALHVNQLAEELLCDGFKEVQNFVELHKRHLPCFTWVVSDDDNSTTDPLGSRIGGMPAMYADEAWPSGQRLFAFQINMAKVPRRMQYIVGSSGLFQFFWGSDDQMSGYGRVVPAADLDKLMLRPDLRPPSDDDTTDLIVPGAITGWIERADYPCDPRPDFQTSELGNKSLDLHCSVNKFGGYAAYRQDAERWDACPCGANHLGREETFHFVGNSTLRFMSMGMGGQVMYCPNDAKRGVTTRCSCD